MAGYLEGTGSGTTNIVLLVSSDGLAVLLEGALCSNGFMRDGRFAKRGKVEREGEMAGTLRISR